MRPRRDDGDRLVSHMPQPLVGVHHWLLAIHITRSVVAGQREPIITHDFNEYAAWHVIRADSLRPAGVMFAHTVGARPRVVRHHVELDEQVYLKGVPNKEQTPPCELAAHALEAEPFERARVEVKAQRVDVLMPVARSTVPPDAAKAFPDWDHKIPATRAVVLSHGCAPLPRTLGFQACGRIQLGHVTGGAHTWCLQR